MSPHAVNNFVSDLVAMAQAMEELPKVREALGIERELSDKKSETIADRELHILELKANIEALQTKLREAEVAKDSAETMFLEADERTSRALDFIKATFGNAGSLIQALEPVKAMPVEQGESASPLAPISNPGQYFSGGPGDHGESHSGESVGVSQAPNSTPEQGQSEPDPTVSSMVGQFVPTAMPVEQDVTELTPPTSGATSATSWATPTPQPDTPPAPAKPYEHVNYIDVPGWISREDWLAGGGTDEGYDFLH